jgi:xanthine/CO dehydrogenase XdhC/CoxF family maturation factor
MHAPIGIDINAETPEEIGVSIVAEMYGPRLEAHRTRALGSSEARLGSWPCILRPSY